MQPRHARCAARPPRAFLVLILVGGLATAGCASNANTATSASPDSVQTAAPASSAPAAVASVSSAPASTPAAIATTSEAPAPTTAPSVTLTTRQMRSALITADDMPGGQWTRASEESLDLTSGFFEWTPTSCNDVLDDLTGAVLTSPGAKRVITGFERGTGEASELVAVSLVQTTSPVDITALESQIASLVSSCPQLTSVSDGTSNTFSAPLVVTLTQSEVPVLGDGSTGVRIQIKVDTLSFVFDIMVIVQGNHLISVRTAGAAPLPELQSQVATRALDRLGVVLADPAG